MSVGSVGSCELPSRCDVAIVGAGPIGMMLANLLGMARVDVVIIERNKGLVGLPPRSACSTPWRPDLFRTRK